MTSSDCKKKHALSCPSKVLPRKKKESQYGRTNEDRRLDLSLELDKLMPLLGPARLGVVRTPLSVPADLLRVALDTLQDGEQHVRLPVLIGALSTVLDELDDTVRRAERRLEVKVDLDEGNVREGGGNLRRRVGVNERVGSGRCENGLKIMVQHLTVRKRSVKKGGTDADTPWRRLQCSSSQWTCNRS